MSLKQFRQCCCIGYFVELTLSQGSFHSMAQADIAAGPHPRVLAYVAECHNAFITVSEIIEGSDTPRASSDHGIAYASLDIVDEFLNFLETQHYVMVDSPAGIRQLPAVSLLSKSVFSTAAARGLWNNFMEQYSHVIRWDADLALNDTMQSIKRLSPPKEGPPTPSAPTPSASSPLLVGRPSAADGSSSGYCQTPPRPQVGRSSAANGSSSGYCHPPRPQVGRSPAANGSSSGHCQAARDAALVKLRAEQSRLAGEMAHSKREVHKAVQDVHSGIQGLQRAMADSALAQSDINAHNAEVAHLVGLLGIGGVGDCVL